MLPFAGTHDARFSLGSTASKLALAFTCLLLALLFGVATAAARPEYRGAQVHSLWSSVSASEMTRELNALQEAGADVMRVDVGWATLETAKGHYDSAYLAKLDSLVSGADERGIKIVATLWQTPSWASAGGNWNEAPLNPSDYGAFARFITARYGTKLAAVEAWNEPEINENLVSSNLPETYTQMVKAFYTGAKEGDPEVEVLAGSLAYADIPFLKALYADGIQGYYDAISVHPYADGAAPANTSVTHSFVGGIEQLHAAQVQAGDSTPEWVTEFGWPTGTSRGANSEQQQAEYIEQAFGILDGISYVRGATVYQLRDMGSEASNPEDNFGLLHQNFTASPAYNAFQTAMRAAPGEIPGTPPSFQDAPERGAPGTVGSEAGSSPTGASGAGIAPAGGSSGQAGSGSAPGAALAGEASDEGPAGGSPSAGGTAGSGAPSNEGTADGGASGGFSGAAISSGRSASSVGSHGRSHHLSGRLGPHGSKRLAQVRRNGRVRVRGAAIARRASVKHAASSSRAARHRKRSR